MYDLDIEVSFNLYVDISLLWRALKDLGECHLTLLQPSNPCCRRVETLQILCSHALKVIKENAPRSTF